MNRAIIFAFLCFACFEAHGGTKEWRQHRDAAREAIKKNNLTDALASYGFALAEAETAFKGADMRYLETAVEAGDFFNRQRQYEGARAIAQKALTRLDKPKPGESLYKAALLIVAGDSFLYSSEADDAAKSYQAAYDISRVSLGPRHPVTGAAVQGLASTAVEREDYGKALEHLQEALAIAHRPEAYQG